MSAKTLTLIERYEPSGGVARDVEVQLVYTAQRWPTGAQVTHEPSGKRVTIVRFEIQGQWLGHTGAGGLERYVAFPMYLVRTARGSRHCVPDFHLEDDADE